MSWCMECGARGTPERATITVEGDPLCGPCAKARGGDVAPSAPKEQVMTEEAVCGCGRPQIHKGRCAYRRQSGPVPEPVKRGTVRRAIPIRAAQPAMPTAVIDVASKAAVLDHVWSTLTPELKLRAITALLS